ncbi:MAG: transcriptional regulator, LysR family [Firmicutes bacterium]|nr:transcriptional regulator, LysR family [Bacillota bacterium]
MDLRHLEYFQMVAKLNNVTRAAEQLYVSQSTVTLAIQKLEEELGLQLFDRSQKQFLLTTEGHVFLQGISDILNKLQDTISEMHKYCQLQKGTLNVGVPPMIGSFLFPEILASFKIYYPNLQLSILEEGSVTIRHLLEKGELDLGIVNLYQPSPMLETLKMAREQFAVCLPANHPLAENTVISLDQLRDESFILFKEGAYNRDLILRECKKYGFTPNIILSSDQIETIRSLVIKGIGISFLIEKITRKNKECVSIPLSTPLYLDFGLAWKKDKYLSKAAQAFMSFITELNCLSKSAVE